LNTKKLNHAGHPENIFVLQKNSTCIRINPWMLFHFQSVRLCCTARAVGTNLNRTRQIDTAIIKALIVYLFKQMSRQYTQGTELEANSHGLHEFKHSTMQQNTVLSRERSYRKFYRPRFFHV
jgi:hypothetical protein